MLFRSIPGTPDAEVKAYRVTRVFNALFLLKNTMDWSFVRNMGVRELRQFFEKLDGGDPVMAAAMAMFFSTGHAIPADADVQRTLRRLGLAEENEDVVQLQSFLERAVSKEEGAETWSLLHRLAEVVCLPGEPLCEKCPVAALCPFGQQTLAAKRQKKSPARTASAPKAAAPAASPKASAAKSEPRSAKAKPAKSTTAQKVPAVKAKKPSAPQSAAKVKPAAKTAGVAKPAANRGKAPAKPAAAAAKPKAKPAPATKTAKVSSAADVGKAKSASRAATAGKGRSAASRSRGR